MNCDDALKLASLDLDARLDGASRASLMAHQSTCSRCATSGTADGRLRAALRALPRETADGALVDRIADAAVARSRTPQTPIHRFGWLRVAAAVIVLVGGSIGAGYRLGHEPTVVHGGPTSFARNEDAYRQFLRQDLKVTAPEIEAILSIRRHADAQRLRIDQERESEIRAVNADEDRNVWAHLSEESRVLYRQKDPQFSPPDHR